ncbi:MAG: substrate-binding domain-containing protein [Oscillospiraceae bacterium]
MFGKRERTTLAAIAVIIVVIALFMISGTLSANKATRIFRIAVVIDETNDEYWKIFRKGLEQAALDCNVDMHFLSLPQGGEALTQQMELITRETKSGADAVILSAVNQEKMAVWLKENPLPCPIVAVGTRIENVRKSLFVGADGEQVGAELAKSVVAESGYSSVIVFLENENASAKARYNGLTKALDKDSVRYSTVTGIVDMRSFLTKTNQSGKTAAICVDEETLEKICAMADTRPNCDIYGTGYTNKILYYLEMGKIKKIALQSEYDAGYMSIVSAVNAAKSGQYKDFMLKTYIADASNMFDASHESVLVPIS